MITNNNSWSLGATPNKSLEHLEPSIPIHLPGDPLQIHHRKNRVRSWPFFGHLVFGLGVSQCLFLSVLSVSAPLCPLCNSFPCSLRKYLIPHFSTSIL